MNGSGGEVERRWSGQIYPIFSIDLGSVVDEFWDVVDAATTEADADGPMCTRVVNTHRATSIPLCDVKQLVKPW